jgi:hypothetical protein
VIHVLHQPATSKEFNAMLETLETYLKVVVDIRREVLAGGGELHADCEAALLEDGSQQTDLWGADWYPTTKSVSFVSFINIRPRQSNRSMEIQDPTIRKRVEAIVRRLLDIKG